MAISRHSDEWKRVIATAALAGVTFTIYHRRQSRAGGHTNLMWRASLPIMGGGMVEAMSKYEAALKALRIMEGNDV